MYGTGQAFVWVMRQKAMEAQAHIMNGFQQSNRHLFVMIQEKEPVYRVLLDGQQLAAKMTDTMRTMTLNRSITVTLNVEKINDCYR